MSPARAQWVYLASVCGFLAIVCLVPGLIVLWHGWWQLLILVPLEIVAFVLMRYFAWLHIEARKAALRKDSA